MLGGQLSPELFYQGHDAFMVEMYSDWTAERITQTYRITDMASGTVWTGTQTVGFAIVPDRRSRMTAIADGLDAWQLRIDDFAERGGFLGFYAGRVFQDFVVAPFADGARAWGEGNFLGVGVAAAGALIKPVRAGENAVDAIDDVVDQVRRGPRVHPMPDLPALDETGKLSGALPQPGDLHRYTVDDLSHLRDQLQTSVQTRIDVRLAKGADFPHNVRLTEELQLFQSIQTHLRDR